ncbi:MAG TPA: hypothetical protein VLE23_08365 [Geminicoccaceae bacterium]|nr:hypothetical protein [Geminicoccaceae bacterium]
MTTTAHQAPSQRELSERTLLMVQSRQPDAGGPGEALVESIADDKLDGVAAIAAFRGEPVRRCRYLIELGELPVGREGNWIIASRRVLLDDLRRKTGGAAAPKAT